MHSLTASAAQGLTPAMSAKTVGGGRLGQREPGVIHIPRQDGAKLLAGDRASGLKLRPSPSTIRLAAA